MRCKNCETKVRLRYQPDKKCPQSGCSNDLSSDYDAMCSPCSLARNQCEFCRAPLVVEPVAISGDVNSVAG